MGILIASVLLGMHLLTQNGCPWGIKYSKCRAFLVISRNFFFASQSVHFFSWTFVLHDIFFTVKVLQEFFF